MHAYTPDELSKLLRSFEAIPLHRHYGLRFAQDAEGPFVRFEVTPELTGGFDYLHGGVLYAVLDVASAFAVVPHLRRGVQEKTVDVHITMIRSARLGETVEIRAEVEHLGRSNAFLRAQAFCAHDRRLLARAHVTKAFAELDKLAAADALARGERLAT